MVTPGMLQNPAVRAWLDGIEPAWTLLDQDSFDALNGPPSPTDGPIQLAVDLAIEEIHLSAVSRNALIVLRAAAEGSGLKTTATGNLARSVVAEMCEQFSWPGFDSESSFGSQRVINEPDFLPLYFIRNVAEAAQLIRRQKGFLKTTPAGRKSLEQPYIQSLQAILFHIAFWHLDIGYFSYDFLHGWPQRDIGVVLWSLSVAATDWQSPKSLSRLCTIPIIGVLEGRQWDMASHAMEARILRPLTWFGLIEYRREAIEGSRFDRRHFYRKTALFDRFLLFSVGLEGASAMLH